jgi:hypothetical protein
VYFLVGTYKVEIEEVKLKTARDGVEVFIISAKVLESTNSERPAGCKASQVIKLRPDLMDTALSNIKQFLGTAMGIANPDLYVPEDGQDLAEFWEQSFELAVSSDQPLEGLQLGLNCTNKLTKAGKDFTVHNWSMLGD